MFGLVCARVKAKPQNTEKESGGKRGQKSLLPELTWGEREGEREPASWKVCGFLR